MGLTEEKKLDSEYIMHTFGRKDVEFVKGSGMHLEDSNGDKYLDFLSGIGVCSLGHCHPVVVDAIKSQAERLIHVSNYFYIENRGELAKKLSDLLDFEPLGVSGAHAKGANTTKQTQRTGWKTFFANSGAEANECAIKAARLFAKNKAVAKGQDPSVAPTAIITLVRSFHGRTLATLAATGQSKFHEGFEPIPEGFLPTPINDIDALKGAFESLRGAVCAVMVEPIQGESGVHVCSDEFLIATREICDEYGALMICDEVQCGIFRTGMPFAFQHAGILPDIVTIAKGIASGIPCGACAARGEVADTLSPGQHGSTFGGSNIAVSTALATLEELSKPGFAEQIEEMGNYLMGRASELEGVIDVRGRGLMVGMDLRSGLDAPQVVTDALANGLVINATGPSTVRLLPPLICKKADIDEFLDNFVAALAKQL